MRGGHGQRRVVRLILAEQVQPQVAVLETRTFDLEHVPSPTHGLRTDAHLTTEAPQWRALGGRAGFDNLERLTAAAGGYAIALLDYGRLLSRDLSNRAAEIFLVVEVDIGDHSDPEVERVGCVEPATKPDL